MRATYGPGGALDVAENRAAAEDKFMKGILGLGALGVALGGVGMYSLPKLHERMVGNYLKKHQGVLLAGTGLAGVGLAGLGDWPSA